MVFSVFGKVGSVTVNNRTIRSRSSSVSSAGSSPSRSSRSRTPSPPRTRASIFNYLARPYHQPLRDALRARRVDEMRRQPRLAKKSSGSSSNRSRSKSRSRSLSRSRSRLRSRYASRLKTPCFGSSPSTKRSRSNVKRAGHASRSRFRSSSRSTSDRSAPGPSRSYKKHVAKRGCPVSGQQAGRGRSRSTSTRRAARVVKSALSRKNEKAKSPKSKKKCRFAADC